MAKDAQKHPGTQTSELKSDQLHAQTGAGKGQF